MKTAVKHTKSQLYIYRRPYPNAAEPRYFLEKVVDGILAVCTGMGAVTIILFLITM